MPTAALRGSHERHHNSDSGVFCADGMDCVADIRTDMTQQDQCSAPPYREAAMRLDARRFVRCEELTGGQRYRVGPGDRRAGQSGVAIAVIALRHSPGYEIVLHLDSGKQDSFAPMQLFPVTLQEQS